MASLQLPSVSQALPLLAAAQFSPMTIWAVNAAEIGPPKGLIIWIGILWGLALGAWVLCVAMGAAPETTTLVIFWFLLGFTVLGLLANDTMGGSASLLVILLVFCGLVYRLRDLPGLRWFQTWVVIFIGIYPIGSAALVALTTPEPQLEEIPSSEHVAFEDTKDVVLVVFDAHASQQVLAEFFSVESTPSMQATTESVVTEVPIMSNYTLTHLSLSSFFDMGYPVRHGDRVGAAEWAAMMRTVRGSNNLVRAFKDQGYELVVVESGWAGFHCSHAADTCIGNPWPDEATMLAMKRTLLRPLIGQSLEATARGALNSIRWLEVGLPDVLDNGRPDLVVAHLMLPHPPLRLDGDCELRQLPNLGGRTVGAPSFSSGETAQRKAAYVEAVACASRVISQLATSIGERAYLVAIGDHGPDSQGQLHLRPADWEARHIRERMGVLFATNSDCPVEGIRSLVNVGPWLLGCMASEPYEPIREEFYVAVGSSLGLQYAVPEPIRRVTDVVEGDHESQLDVGIADGN